MSNILHDQTSTATRCPDWCTTNHVNDPDGGHDGPHWPAVESIAGPEHRVLVSAAQHETGSMVVYLAAADLPLTSDQARAAGLALLSAASWAKDHKASA